MTFAYATSNKFAGLAASAFTFPTGGGPLDATRSYLNDGRMDARYIFNTLGTSDVIQISFASPQTLCAIAILNHNLATIGAGTIAITAADDTGFTTGVIAPKATTTLNTAAPKQKDSILQFTAVSKQFWRITIGHASSSALAIGELYGVGTSTTLTRGRIDGSGENERFITADVEMQNGNVKSMLFAGPMRSIDFKVTDYTFSQRDELMALWRAVKGTVNPFLWIESYENGSLAAANAEQDCLFGRFTMPQYKWSFSDANLVQPDGLMMRSEARELGS